VTMQAPTWNSGNNTATFSYGGIMPDGNYRATLSAAGITHSQGTPMPADYVLDFFVLTADANHDRHVNVQDFNALANNYNQSPRDASQGDFNYDGTVNVQDFNLLAGLYNTYLAPASGANDGNSAVAGAPPGAPGGNSNSGGLFSGGFIGDSSNRDDAGDPLI